GRRSGSRRTEPNGTRDRSHCRLRATLNRTALQRLRSARRPRQEPLEMTQAAAAKALGMSTVRLNEVVRGKRGVTADTALRLAQLFKTTPEFWMHMQANFELKAAMVRRRALKLAKRA